MARVQHTAAATGVEIGKLNRSGAAAISAGASVAVIALVPAMHALDSLQLVGGALEVRAASAGRRWIGQRLSLISRTNQVGLKELVIEIGQALTKRSGLCEAGPRVERIGCAPTYAGHVQAAIGTGCAVAFSIWIS